MEQEIKYRLYSRNKYVEEYKVNEDGTETSIRFYRILHRKACIINNKPGTEFDCGDTTFQCETTTINHRNGIYNYGPIVRKW